jgi:hypothetical protein
MIGLSQVSAMKGNVCDSMGKYELIEKNSMIHTEIEELKVRIYNPLELSKCSKFVDLKCAQ